MASRCLAQTGASEAGVRCSGWVTQRMMRSEDLPQKTVPKQRRREWLCHSALGEPRVLPGGGCLKGQEGAIRQVASTPSGPDGRLAVPRRHIKHETDGHLQGGWCSHQSPEIYRKGNALPSLGLEG